jgi:hypothetical protein
VTGADERARSLRDWLTTPAAAVVAAVVTLAIVGLVAFGGDDDDEPASDPQAANPPAPLKAPEIAALSEQLGRPVYWAGAQGATEFELTRQGEERIAIRYPAGAGADPSAGTLTVATYRLDDAIAAIRRAAEGETAKLHQLPRRGLAVSDSARPTNVYLAYPDEPYQVEVFDPQAGRALELVLDGKVRPVR